MKIEVTPDDIARGKPGSSCACPVALGCRRVGLVEPDVYGRVINVGRFVFGRSRAHYVAPPEVLAFTRAFDAGEPVEPFAFDLEATP